MNRRSSLIFSPAHKGEGVQAASKVIINIQGDHNHDGGSYLLVLAMLLAVANCLRMARYYVMSIDNPPHDALWTAVYVNYIRTLSVPYCQATNLDDRMGDFGQFLHFNGRQYCNVDSYQLHQLGYAS